MQMQLQTNFPGFICIVVQLKLHPGSGSDYQQRCCYSKSVSQSVIPSVFLRDLQICWKVTMEKKQMPLGLYLDLNLHSSISVFSQGLPSWFDVDGVVIGLV